MESPSRVLIKCCDCGCPTCSLIAKPSSTSIWFRSVKRKFDEFETGNRFYVPGFDLYSNPKLQIENECVALRETVCSQQGTIQDLRTELDKERNASSTAATEAMSMIFKLQEQKAEIQMEASQFKRFAEEKMAHHQKEIAALEDLLYKREQIVQSLTCEALAYKHRMMSYGLTEAEAKGEEGDGDGDGDGDGEIQDLGMAENSDSEADNLPAYDYPPLKCNLNENPGDHDVEDVEKYAFDESPHTREERMSRAERSASGSPVTKNDYDKVIVGHSPRRPRHSRRFSRDSYSSFLAKEMASEFTIDSPRFNIASPGFNTSFKKTEFVSKMDEISSSRRMDNASEAGDDMSDRVYTVDEVHNGATYNETHEPKAGVGTSDEYAYMHTPRAAFNMPDIGDPEIKKLYTRLQTLEADRESMRQALLSMQTDKAQLVLLKEIAQHLSKDMPSNRQDVVPKPSVIGSLPFMSVFKWIGSLISWRKTSRRKYLYGLSPNNVGLLMLLDNGHRLRQWRCLSSTQV